MTGFACSAAEASGSGNKKEGDDTRKGGPGESETEVSTPDSEEPKAAGEPEGAAHDAEGTKGKQPDLQGAAVEQLKEELGQKDQQIETLNLKVTRLQLSIGADPKDIMGLGVVGDAQKCTSIRSRTRRSSPL